MNENTQYVIDSVKSWIWSGFYSRDSIIDMFPDIMEDDVDEDLIINFIDSEFIKKKSDEHQWDEITDCDRLDKLFSMLNEKKIIALQNAGYTMSDGQEDVSSIHETRPHGYFLGYCFYHGQDLERAITGGNLFLAFGDMKGTAEGKKIVADLIINYSENCKLKTIWDGNVDRRIEIVNLNWRRRFKK